MPVSKGRVKRRPGAKKRWARRRASKALTFGGGKKLGNPLPVRLNTKLRYSDVIGLDTLNGSFIVNVYRANSIFDPDYTNGGSNHQPRGRDELANFYYQYTVYKATMMFTVCLPQLTSADAICAFVHVDGDVTQQSTLQNYLEAGHTKWQWMSMNDRAVATIRYPLNVFKFVGKTYRTGEPDSELRAAIGGNPNEEVYFHVGIASPSSFNPTSITCHVTIDYDVIYTEPKVLGAS